MNETRIFGPPGTGKTTYLARQVHLAAAKRGSSNIMVASFTRAAATEIAGRDLPIAEKQTGTLHAMCYRQLGHPIIAEGNLKDWNTEVPHLQLSAGGTGDLDHAAFDQAGQTEGDRLLSNVERLRAQMRPIESWPNSARSFYKRWCTWKNKHDLMDFTDLIEKSLNSPPPGNVTVGFFDEVQDFTPLDLALVRNWATQMDTVLLAGDDDQCIYRFRGSSPDAFLDPPLPDSQKRILSQSYRLPRTIHTFAQAWVQHLTRREPKDYEPRDDVEGDISIVEDANWRNIDRVIDRIAEDEQAGRDVMLLTTCSYMLEPAIAALRRRGIPFHNPYRRKRGDWNPLAPRKDSVTATDRILALLRPDVKVWGEEARMWTALDAHWWMQPMRADKMFRRGAKSVMARRSRDQDDVRELDIVWLLENIFQDQADFDHAFVGDLNWWEDALLAKAAKTLSFPLQIARSRGPAALADPPKVTVGTIHSVKGGEADCVYLCPDVSTAGMREWLTAGEARDSVIRQFYVGMTRAREHLALVPPLARTHIPLERYLPEEVKP